MEVTPLMIYLIATLDNILNLLIAFIGLVVSIGIPAFFMSLACDFKEETRIKWVKRILAAFFTCIILLILIPSTKTMTAMYLIPPIANNQSVQELPAEILSFVKEYLKDGKFG